MIKNAKKRLIKESDSIKKKLSFKKDIEFINLINIEPYFSFYKDVVITRDDDVRAMYL